MYLIHFPIALKYVDPTVRYPPGWKDENNKVVPIKAPLHETWAAMEQLQEEGLAKSIGVSNYNGQSVIDLLRYARIPPAVLQIEHHPYLTQEGLVKLCNDHNIAITAYSSFGPQSFLELKFKKAQDAPLLFEHPTISKISQAHNKSPAQVLLRWATQRGVAVIPKSNNQGRLQANLDLTGWDLTPSELKEISGLDKGLRFNNPTDYDVNQPIFV